MLVLCGLSGINLRRLLRIQPNASTVPPLVSMSRNTGSAGNASPSASPAHAWRILFCGRELGVLVAALYCQRLGGGRVEGNEVLVIGVIDGDLGV
jgi:hypothetical protein